MSKAVIVVLLNFSMPLATVRITGLTLKPLKWKQLGSTFTWCFVKDILGFFRYKLITLLRRVKRSMPTWFMIMLKVNVVF